MAIGITGYHSYAAQGISESYAPSCAKNQEAENTNETVRQTEQRQGAVYTPSAFRRQGLTEYVRELAKLAPSMQVRVGDGFPRSRSGKTLTIHPGLLNKMQHDPQQEQTTKEMIQGAEFLTKWLDGLYKATGRTLVFRHSYIDENGKYRAFSYVRNDKSLQMCKKMRVQRQKNAQKLIAKTRAKAAKKQRTVGTKLDVRC